MYVLQSCMQTPGWVGTGTCIIRMHACTAMVMGDFHMVRWINYLDGGLEPYPNLQRFMDNMSKDYGVQQALIREGA